MNRIHRTEQKAAPLLAHLGELRYRLLVIVAVVLVGSGVAYGFSDQLLDRLAKPLGQPLIFLAPMEALMVRLKLSVFGGVMLTLPISMFHVWRFLSPGLTREERWLAWIFMPLLVFFFVGGVLFAYVLVIPAGLAVLLSFGSADLKPMISVGSYFSFVLAMLFAFGLTFELPPILFVLARLGVVTSKQLRKLRPYAVLLIFVAAALLTPTPDIVNQLFLAVPLLILYEGSLLVIRLTGR